MTREAGLEQTEAGLVPQDDGWFVVNVRDARWFDTRDMGRYTSFEGETDFPHFGIGIHVVDPGQANAMYHAESNQEGFLVLSGECVLLVEGEERRLKAWDFFHCPPGTEHIIVGAGSGPCAILMAGARQPDEVLRYPVSELAQRYGAGVERETTAPKEAYAGRDRPAPVPFRAGDLPA